MHTLVQIVAIVVVALLALVLCRLSDKKRARKSSSDHRLQPLLDEGQWPAKCSYCPASGICAKLDGVK